MGLSCSWEENIQLTCLRPNCLSIARVCCCQVGLLEAMEADGVAADAVTFNTVIAACEAGADHWTAFRCGDFASHAVSGKGVAAAVTGCCCWLLLLSAAGAAGAGAETGAGAGAAGDGC